MHASMSLSGTIAIQPSCTIWSAHYKTKTLKSTFAIKKKCIDNFNQGRKPSWTMLLWMENTNEKYVVQTVVYHLKASVSQSVTHSYAIIKFYCNFFGFSFTNWGCYILVGHTYSFCSPYYTMLNHVSTWKYMCFDTCRHRTCMLHVCIYV